MNFMGEFSSTLVYTFDHYVHSSFFHFMLRTEVPLGLMNLSNRTVKTWCPSYATEMGWWRNKKTKTLTLASTILPCRRTVLILIAHNLFPTPLRCHFIEINPFQRTPILASHHTLVHPQYHPILG